MSESGCHLRDCENTVIIFLLQGRAVGLAHRAHNPKVTGSNPVPATKLVLYNFLHRSKENLLKFVVTSLGCCSTQSTLANVRVLFCFSICKRNFT